MQHSLYVLLQATDMLIAAQTRQVNMQVGKAIAILALEIEKMKCSECSGRGYLRDLARCPQCAGTGQRSAK